MNCQSLGRFNDRNTGSFRHLADIFIFSSGLWHVFRREGHSLGRLDQPDVLNLCSFHVLFSCVSMKLPFFLRLLFLSWLCCTLCLGCSTQSSDQGIVAKVNGEPIFLEQLEARHDLKYLAGTGGYVPSVERLQSEYGMALSEMVINMLVSQYLANRDLEVTDQELDAVEMQVRADYPEDSFEQMLVEEYIDLALWREQLRATLSQEKLFQKVLRPRISIEYQEVDAYYRENIVDFYLSPKMRFLYIMGSEKESVEKLLELSRAEDDPTVLGKRFDRVEVHDYTLREDSIAMEWRSRLDALEPGQATGVLSRDEQDHEAFVLLERTPGRIVDLAQAYSLVERILVERKLQEAFNAWLASELDAARVEVNTELLQKRLDNGKIASGSAVSGSGE